MHLNRRMSSRTPQNTGLVVQQGRCSAFSVGRGGRTWAVGTTGFSLQLHGKCSQYPVLHLARYSKILVHHHDATIWRFPKTGYPKLAGWFISWKKTKKMMIWRSYDLGNLHQKRSGFCIPQDFHDSERPFAHCPVAS